jgi:UrcA family protein
MRYGTFNRRALRIVLAAAAAVSVGGPVAAAPPDEEVVVESAPLTLIHRSPYGTEQVVSITRHVSFADLDLVTYSGTQELKARINETADSICAKLGRMYGPMGFDRPQCMRDAVRGAMAQARAAIAAAEKRTRTAGLSPRE